MLKLARQIICSVFDFFLRDSLPPRSKLTDPCFPYTTLFRSLRFYSKLFGAGPSVVKSDYAKWMLDDPRVNFAISQRDGKPGVNHLGFQVDSDARSEEHTSELQSLMRISYAVFCLNKKQQLRQELNKTYIHTYKRAKVNN